MKRLNCVSFEPLIALFVEGDLRESDRLRVEKHLKSCARCGELLIELQKSQAAFKTLRQGVVNSGALSEVRERVLNDIGDLDPAPAWAVAVHRMIFAGLRRRTAIAGVAVGALVLGGVWLGLPHHEAEPSREPASPLAIAAVNEPTIQPDATEEQTFVKPEKTPNSRKHRAIPKERDTRVAAQTDSVQFPIKFVTDDPNIIIYWLPSDKGD